VRRNTALSVTRRCSSPRGSGDAEEEGKLNHLTPLLPVADQARLAAVAPCRQAKGDPWLAVNRRGQDGSEGSIRAPGNRGAADAVAPERPQAVVEQRSVQPTQRTGRGLWGYLVWGVLALFVALFELLAAFDDDNTPWPTLSRTTGNLQDDYPVTAIPILAGLVVLGARIVFYPWPNRRSES
jgi:hypothetical protein